MSLLSTFPENTQTYLTQDFRNENPFNPKSANEIYSELAASRACYERGEYEDFDDALNDLSIKYCL